MKKLLSILVFTLIAFSGYSQNYVVNVSGSGTGVGDSVRKARNADSLGLLPASNYLTTSSAAATYQTLLGFTPYNATNPSGFITASSLSPYLTTAIAASTYEPLLGFTPYNSTNPSNYITMAALSGYLTSATAASTYEPLLGFTPYNATNPSGYITPSSTSTLTNKSGNISQWTNNSGYITGFTELDPVWLADKPAYLTSAIAASTYEPLLGYTAYNATNPSGYISGNQTITLSGDISGTGTTAITTAIGNLKVLNAMIANGTIDLTTKVTGLLPDGNISSASTWNAKQAALVNNVNLKSFNYETLLGATNISEKDSIAYSSKVIGADSSLTIDKNLAGTKSDTTKYGPPGSSINMLTGLNGDGYTIGTGMAQLVLHNVNYNVGRRPDAIATYNAKGQVTQVDSMWQNITATTKTMVAGEGYVSTSTANAQIVYTLPAIAYVGQTFSVTGGSGTGGWRVGQNASQVIKYNTTSANATTTTGTGGYIQSGNQYDAVEIICIVANTTFLVKSSQGALTVN